MRWTSLVHCCLAGLLCLASARGAETDSPFSRDYAAEICRYMYRWHLDETALHSVDQYDDIEFWVRRVETQLDKDDRSVFCEMIAPRLNFRIRLKKADYRVPELDVHVRNETFKILEVDRYEKLPAAKPEYEVFRFERKEILEYLFETRNKHTYPDKALREHLGKALRGYLGDNAPRTEESQTVYIAPLSPVSNDLWVYWESARKLIRFSSDADLATPAYWKLEDIGVRVFDLNKDVVVAMAEVPGSNAYVTRDWAARVLFNCVATGQRLVVSPESP